MKRIYALLGAAILAISCQETKPDRPNMELQELQSENDSLRRKLDSITKLVNEVGLMPTEPISEDDAPKSAPSVAKNPKAGTHPITLHWISWDRPGKATLTPIDDVWYKISGKQANATGDYLTIEGRIRRIGEKELEFDGTIITKTATTNQGEPCTKTGLQRFFGKGSRNYYRLQNMENCEGGMLVDYVDIYPGTSGL